MFVSLDRDVELVAGELDETYVDPGLPDLEHEGHVLPDELESISPGPFLGAILSSVDLSRLSGHDVVRYVVAQERLVSHYQAAYYTGVAELAYAIDPDTTDRGTVPNEFASDELQAALAKTRRSADADVDLAVDLLGRLPRVWEALREGRIDLRRARVFSNELTILAPEMIEHIVDDLLPEASELTTGQLASRLRRRVIQADPQAADGQYQAGLEDRRFSAYPNPDHTANLFICSIPPEDAVSISEDIHSHAVALKGLPGETRTVQQIMADIAIDRLKEANSISTSRSARPKLVVHLKPGDVTAHVPGYGPILPTSLQILTDRAESISISGAPVLTGTGGITAGCHETNSRQPTCTQAEHVRSQYPTCIFMGCRMPAEKCDIDHRHPHHKGGKTVCINLAPLCRHHHSCKTKTNWNLERNPDGSHTWTSPLGHTYTTRAPP